MTTEELNSILETGASVTVNTSSITMRDLRKLIRTASANGGKLTLEGADTFTPQELLLLAEEAKPGCLDLGRVKVN